MVGYGGPKGLMLALACVVAAVSGCADRQLPAPAEGKLAVSQGEFDFQRVGLHAIRRAKLTMTNLGRGGITVEDVWIEGPTGNFLARFEDAGPHQLLTEESCELELRFNPRVAGFHQGELVIRTDNPRERIFRIPLRGEGVETLVQVGTDVLDFGRIEADSEKKLLLPLESVSDLPVTVTPRWIGADADEFAHEGGESFVLEPFGKREVGVFFRPTRVAVKKIALAISPCENCPETLVDVRGEALERALVFQPPFLDFGGVPMDRDATRTLLLTNVSTEPAEVKAMRVAEDTDASFTVGGFTTPVTIAPGASEQLEVRYSPGHTGEAKGLMTFEVASRRHPSTDVTLRGVGGATELCVSPVVVDFGIEPVGARESRKITLKNCGTAAQGALTITGLRIDPASVSGPATFDVGPETMPIRLEPGEEEEVRVFFEPLDVGPASAALTIDTDAFQSSGATVTILGEGRDHLPCQVAVTPQLVDFGTVPPGRGAVLGIKVQNVGVDECPVKRIRFADDAGGRFFFPGSPVQGVKMGPGDAFSFMVAFQSPPEGGTFSGAVEMDVANPAAPRATIPLIAHSQESCLVATPWYVDFGYGRLECPAAPQEIRYVNACATDVTVTDIAIGAGTTDGEFELSSIPRLPLVVAPGDAFTVRVNYRAEAGGMNLSPLFVTTTELPRPLEVTLLGESSATAEELDQFVQQDGKMVDVLFVVDNTASMVEEQPKLKAAMPAFAEAALQRGVDLNVAVTTTGIEEANDACPGGAKGGEAGRLFPADGSAPRLLTETTSDLGAALQRNVDVGLCAYVERGLEAARRALTEPLVDSYDDPRTPLLNDGNGGFLRDAAALALVFVGDEDDNSPDSVQTYVRAFQQLKGIGQPQRTAIYAIAPGPSTCESSGAAGTRYQEAAQRTGGEVLSVCASDYAPLLRSVAGKAFSPQDSFPLSQTPETGTLRVFLDGRELQGGWSYSSSSNAVDFDSAPAAGSQVEVAYRRACGG